MNDKISVLMSVYNTREDWLRAAIESVLGQTYRNIEFVIVIDCPTDGSKSIIEEYARKDDRILLINNETNIGLTASLNKGIVESSGKYIARMDSDDIAFPNRIEVQYKYMKSKNCDIIGARIVRIDENSHLIGSPTQKYNEESVNKVLKYTDCIPHPTWLVKRKVYTILHGYRDIRHCEDYDFLMRAIMHDIKIGMCDEVLLKYRVNTSGITRSNSLRQFLTSRFLRKNNNRIEEITQSEVDEYVTKRVSQNKTKAFEESIICFRKGIEFIKNKKAIYGMWNIIKGLTKSRYALTNLWNILNVYRIVKKEC